MFRYTRRQPCRHRACAGGANEEFIYDFVSRRMAVVMHRRIGTNVRSRLVTRNNRVLCDSCSGGHVSQHRWQRVSNQFGYLRSIQPSVDTYKIEPILFDTSCMCSVSCQLLVAAPQGRSDCGHVSAALLHSTRPIPVDCRTSPIHDFLVPSTFPSIKCFSHYVATK